GRRQARPACPEAMAGRPNRQPPYSGSPQQRLSPRLAAALMAVLVLGTATGGCSYRLGALTGKSEDTAERTGSIKPTKVAERTATGTLPPDADLALTKAAVRDLLTRGRAV